MKKLLHTAKAQGARKHLPFSMRRGLVAFFMSCRNTGIYDKFRALKRLRAQTPFIQSSWSPTWRMTISTRTASWST